MTQSTGSRIRKSESFGIGELSRTTGVNIETIRYYEKIKLLKPPPRTQGGRRVYGSAETRVLTFVRRARELGFSLDEIRTLLRLVDRGYTCAEMRDLTMHHLTDIRGKIADLRRMERSLDNVSRQCTGRKAPECPIIDTLFRDPLPRI
ncbi:MAG: MerR family transcriptional regulator [Alphaproteobacteria bacterium]|nr:MerR family transcriptional regulator [Alphaproteobacteria bacterium]